MGDGRDGFRNQLLSLEFIVELFDTSQNMQRQTTPLITVFLETLILKKFRNYSFFFPENQSFFPFTPHLTRRLLPPPPAVAAPQSTLSNLVLPSSFFRLSTGDSLPICFPLFFPLPRDSFALFIFFRPCPGIY